MRSPIKAAALVAALIATAPAVEAYYHFVHFREGSRLVERFALNELPDRTVYFYVSSEQRPLLAANDTYDGLLSQIIQALEVWNQVPTSELRVGFGGIVPSNLPGNAPAGEIVFAEMPPGVVALGGPVTRRSDAGAVSIVRSQVILSNELVGGSRSRASFSELFFNTLVHEIGHALGLQHTLASAAMSTDVTRSTTRARPLGFDDIAGLSALYPADGLGLLTGSISGRVTFSDGSPAALASVAAVHPSGEVITALTDPDGRYVIEGLLAAHYQLYAHPLPPATQQGLGPANIVLPEGVGEQQAATFRTVFYGGAENPEQSEPIAVTAANERTGADFQVERRSAPTMFNVSVYSFPGNGAPGVHPAFLDIGEAPGFVLATGPGLGDDLGRTRIDAIGRSLAISPPTAYGADPRFTRIDFQAAPFAAPGPVNLLIRSPKDLYVLPSAVRLSTEAAPVIFWLTRAPAVPDLIAPEQNSWTIWGANLDPRSEVYFDGRPSEVLAFDEESSEIAVRPPPGPPGHHAVVTVYNPDGQSSSFTLPDGNVIFEYPSGPDLAISVSAAEAPPDSDVVIDVESDSMEFRLGAVNVGVGSTDVVVRQVEVLAPSRLRAVVSVLPAAAPGNYMLTVTSGLQTVKADGAFRVREPAVSDGERPKLRYGGLNNSATGGPELSPGVLASLFGENLAVGGGEAVRVTLNGLQARIFGLTAAQINLEIPEQIPPGVAELKVYNGVFDSEPMLVEIGRVSPGLFVAFNEQGVALSADAPLRPDALVDLFVTGLGTVAKGLTGPDLPAYSPVHIIFGGLRLPPLEIQKLDQLPGVYRMRFRTPGRDAVAVVAGAGSVELSLLVDGRRSNALALAVDRAALGERVVSMR